MKRFFAAVLAALLATAAYGQNAGTVTNHAFALGKGPGVAGYASLLCGSAQLAVGQSAADPICRTLSGDATLSAAGALTLATVSGNVGTFGSATSCVTVTNNAKGLTTAISEATCAPAIGSVTGLAAGVATFLGTPSGANLLAALTTKTGAGLPVFGTSPNITTPTGIVKGDVGLGNVANLLQIVSVKQQKFTAGGTYTPSAGMAYAVIECFGGGGAGGGAVSAAGANNAGGGGGSGGLSRVTATAATVGASKAVTIGAGGTGVSAAAGNAGGDTSVGALCIAKGGSGGGFGQFTVGGVGGAGGVAGTGDDLFVGGSGQIGLGASSGVSTVGASGMGGGMWGGGGSAVANNAAGATGGAGQNYGGGGSGGFSGNGGGAGTGGAGAAGYVRITEYCTQ